MRLVVCCFFRLSIVRGWSSVQKHSIMLKSSILPSDYCFCSILTAFFIYSISRFFLIKFHTALLQSVYLLASPFKHTLNESDSIVERKICKIFGILKCCVIYFNYLLENVWIQHIRSWNTYPSISVPFSLIITQFIKRIQPKNHVI